MIYVAKIRRTLGVSRSTLVRFLGVSIPTMVRWESEDGRCVPHGLALVLLREIERAAVIDLARVREIVRDGTSLDHALAVGDLVALSRELSTRKKRFEPGGRR